MLSSIENVHSVSLNKDGSLYIKYDPTRKPIVHIRDSFGAIATIQLAAMPLDIICIPYLPTNNLISFLKAIDAQRTKPLIIETYDPHPIVQTIIESTKYLILDPMIDRLQENFDNYLQSFNKPLVVIIDSNTNNRELIHHERHRRFIQDVLELDDKRDGELSDRYRFQRYLESDTHFVLFSSYEPIIERRVIPTHRVSLFISHAFKLNNLFTFFSDMVVSSSYYSETPSENVQMVGCY